MPETGIIRAPGPTLPAVRVTTDLDLLTLCNALAGSGYFKDVRDASQAIVKVLYGQELGIPPVSALLSIHIIEGKPAPSANLLAAIVKRSGRYDYRVVERTEQRCVLVCLEHDREEKGNPSSLREVGRVEWTMQDAARAKLSEKENWRRYPRQMLFSRALSELVRTYCPDLFGGAPVYTPEELEVAVNPETGEVLDVVNVAPPAPPAPPDSTGDRRVSERVAQDKSFALPCERAAVAAVQSAEQRSSYAEAAIQHPPRETPAARISRLMTECQRHLQSLGVEKDCARPYFARILGRDVEKFKDLQADDWDDLEGRLRGAVRDRKAYLAAWGEFAKAFGVPPDDRQARLDSTAALIDGQVKLFTSTLLVPAEYQQVAAALRERVQALLAAEKAAPSPASPGSGSAGEGEAGEGAGEDLFAGPDPGAADRSESADLRAFQ